MPGDAPDRALAKVQAAGEGTLLVPLLQKMRGALVREGRGSRFQAEMVARRSVDGYSLVVPMGTLTGRSGQTVLALSRLQLLTSGHGMPRMSGNFFTGGVDLPKITGRMEAGRDGHLGLQVSMEEYRAGNALAALPRLSVHQAPGGALTFGGAARLSGALPGGEARNLVIPLDGHVSAGADLALWERCTDISFDGLTLANLTLDARKLSVCPTPGKPIVTRQGEAWHVAAGVSALDLTGKLGATPVHIASGPVGFAWPGMVKAQNLRIALGPQESASLFHVADLEAKLGKDIAGTFGGADVSLAAVPLDLHDTAGKWAYAQGRSRSAMPASACRIAKRSAGSSRWWRKAARCACSTTASPPKPACWSRVRIGWSRKSRSCTTCAMPRAMPTLRCRGSRSTSSFRQPSFPHWRWVSSPISRARSRARAGSTGMRRA
ncbi:hypothetical protein [Novosphingobium sp. 9]|uniref:intermembrane phospholipid transport protein YdbH family protein n=1 Tax=Novosphingobium sp. 9 TaxID=2025349 RepID=UPI0021B676C3|nr:hypothetical protein [Novosphingobium sp. 9]